MKKKVTVVCLREVGVPDRAACVEHWDLPDLGSDQVLVEMKAAPINPADINVLEGKYPIRPALPAVLGNEGVGILSECGRAVAGLRVGQRVIAPGCMGAWCQARLLPARDVVTLPDEVPIYMGAMLAVNPPTAWRMLHDFVALQPGDWIVQNAANSAVGRLVIQIARQKGWRTVNVVRRKELIEELRAEGADVVVTNEEPLSPRIRDLTGGASIQLGLNAVGGDSARDLARSLAPHGTLVTYGAMGREPMRIENGLLIFRDIRFRGFMITEWFQRASPKQKQELFDELLPLVKQGKLKIPVEKTYPLDRVHDAIRHASQSGRSGKILLVM